MAQSPGPTITLPFSVVDVFTTQRYAGNPLAIVHIPSSVHLTQEQRQKITKEFNLSESVFIDDVEHTETGPVWRVHIHTVTTELSFAGHPTIGAACHLISRFLADSNDKSAEKAVGATLVVPAGRIGITYYPSEKRASASIPHDYHQHGGHMPLATLKALQPALQHPPERSPIASIVRGMTFILIELASVDELSSLRLQPGGVPPELSLDAEWTANGFVGAYFYVRLPDAEDGTRRVRTRMMDFEVAIEDPATGSAAATLGAYLALRDGRAGRVGFRVQQGVEMGRASEIGLEVVKRGDGMGIEEVVLSGCAVEVMSGMLTPP